MQRKLHVHWNNSLKDIIILRYHFYLNLIKNLRLEKVKTIQN